MIACRDTAALPVAARGFTEKVTLPARVTQVETFDSLVKIVTCSVKPAPPIHLATPVELRFLSAF